MMGSFGDDPNTEYGNSNNNLTNGYSATYSNPNEEIPKTPSSPSPKFIAMPGPGPTSHRAGAPPRKKSFKNGPGKRGDKHKKLDKVDKTSLGPPKYKVAAESKIDSEIIEESITLPPSHCNNIIDNGNSVVCKKSNKVKLILPSSNSSPITNKVPFRPPEIGCPFTPSHNSTRIVENNFVKGGMGIDYYFPDLDTSLAPDEDSEEGGHVPPYPRRTLPPLPPTSPPLPAKELPVDDIVIETLSMTLTTSASPPPPSPTPSPSPPNTELWAMRDNLVRVQKEKKELEVIRYDIEQQRLAEKMFPKYKPAQTLPPTTRTKNGIGDRGEQFNLFNDEEEDLGSIETCRLLEISPVPKIGLSTQKGDPGSEDARFFSKSRRRKSLNNLFPSPMSDCSNEEWTISSLTEPPGLATHNMEDPSSNSPYNNHKAVDIEKSFTPSPTKVAESKPKVKEDPDLDHYETMSSSSADPDSNSPCCCGGGGDSDQIYASYECKMVPALKKTLKSYHPLNPSVLIEGVLFRASYLGSTHIYLSQWSNKRHSRTLQAKEAVTQVKACEGENQPRADVDLFISTEKIMVLNTNLQSEQVQVIKYEEIMMDHSLKTISYIADIGDIVVVMARRNLKNIPSNNVNGDTAKDCPDKNEAIDGVEERSDGNCMPHQDDKMICHVFESEEAHLIAQSIGQAFQIAYMDFLKANGIEDTSLFQDMDYQDVLNAQEIFGEELALFAKKETQKEVVIPKAKGEILGIVIVESGWGSMIPTVVVANLLPGGPASRGRLLNIGDQIISINGISLVGLPLANCQNYIKATQRQTVVKLTVVRCSPVVEVKIKRPDPKFQLGFSVQNGTICSLLRGGIAERGGVRVGHRIIEINGDSVVAVPHDKIVKILSTTIGEIHMKTMPTSIFRLLTGQETPTFL